MFTKYTLKEFSAKSNHRPYDKNRGSQGLNYWVSFIVSFGLNAICQM